MNRRKFLVSSGAVITVASLSYYGYNNTVLKLEDKIKRPNPNDFNEPVLKAIAYGATASNPHNTQAWKFKIISITEMLIFVDQNRILTETDPPNRQIHIGCGCFIETASIGMIEGGYATKFEYFPEGQYEREHVGAFPVARLAFKLDSSLKISPLNKVLLARRTSRLPYDNVPITAEIWNKILTLMGKTFYTPRLITDSKTLDEIKPILCDAMKIESHTYRTNEESRVWFRENNDKIASTRDGINLSGNGVTGIPKFFARRQLRGLSAEAWHNKSAIGPFLENHTNKVLSSSNILTLKTPTNTMLEWVKVGQDYTRLQLACLVYGFYMQPLSQVLQEFDEMKNLRNKFEKIMNIVYQEKIQMVLRVGKSEKPYLTYRRNVKNFIS